MHNGAVAGPCSSETGTRLYTSPCRPAPGNRACSLCTTDRDRVLREPTRPAIPGDDLSTDHLVQQTGPAPRRVLLFVGHHVAGAHRALPVVATADAGAHAAIG